MLQGSKKKNHLFLFRGAASTKSGAMVLQGTGDTGDHFSTGRFHGSQKMPVVGGVRDWVNETGNKIYKV